MLASQRTEWETTSPPSSFGSLVFSLCFCLSNETMWIPEDVTLNLIWVLIQIWFSHFQALIYQNVTQHTRFFWYCRRVSSHWLDKVFLLYILCLMSNERLAVWMSSLVLMEFTVVSVWAADKVSFCLRNNLTKGNLTRGSFYTFTHLHTHTHTHTHTSPSL